VRASPTGLREVADREEQADDSMHYNLRSGLFERCSKAHFGVCSQD